MILFLLIEFRMELKIGQTKTYKGKKVICVKDDEPGKGCEKCALFGDCSTMKYSAKDRTDKQFTHFEHIQHEKPRNKTH